MSEKQITKLLDRLDAMLLKLEHIESMLLEQSLPEEEELDSRATEAEKLAILQQEGG